MYKLGKTSLERLKGVCPDLVDVVKRAIEITEIDFGVAQGLRTYEQQLEYFKRGASRTMKSRHLTGHAVDLFPYIDGAARWELPLCREVAKAMKKAAEELNVPIEWGGDWVTFVDAPHFQLPHASYPEDSYSA